MQTPAARVQLAPPKLPPFPPSEKVSTMPVGVMGVPELVSVTVNVHVVATLGTVAGQLTVREVERFQVTEAEFELAEWSASPEYEPVIVTVP